MKRYFRIRIILASMLSFFILMIIAVTAIFLFSYHRMEYETDGFIRSMLTAQDDNNHSYSQNTPPIFGYMSNVKMYPSGFYSFRVTGDGTVTELNSFGLADNIEESIRDQVTAAVLSGQVRGKISSFKYEAQANEDGTSQVILLDISIQLRQIFDFLKSAALVVPVLLVLLLLILLPVSSRIADMFVKNAEQQRQFITDAGHDLKTPVAIIRANLDVLELSQGRSKWSGNIRSQASRLELMVRKLLMMARLDEAQGTLQREPVLLSELLDELWQDYQLPMQQKKISGHACIPDDLRTLADGDMLGQMMHLLLDNAVQYAESEGQILLNAEAENHKILITLTNTVVQVPETDANRLTERFVRGSAARTQKSGGSGIGLAAVKRIVSLHHGKLLIDYPDKKHFRVQVELPAQSESRETVLSSRNIHL